MMVVASSSMPDRLRGALSLWCVEIAAGTFIADLPPEAIDTIWQSILNHGQQANVTMIWETPIGWETRHYGQPSRCVHMQHGVPVTTLINSQ